MILSDRLSHIYQNYSICGPKCKYDSFDIDKMTSNCLCKIKQEIYSEVKEGNFENSIESAFLSSNFGVIKCYNLVFGLEGKLNNIGFWLFGVITILHIPLFVLYFINGIIPLKRYISNEMNNNGYSPNYKNDNYQKILKYPIIETTKNTLTSSKENTNNTQKKK